MVMVDIATGQILNLSGENFVLSAFQFLPEFPESEH